MFQTLYQPTIILLSIFFVGVSSLNQAFAVPFSGSLGPLRPPCEELATELTVDANGCLPASDWKKVQEELAHNFCGYSLSVASDLNTYRTNYSSYPSDLINNCSAALIYCPYTVASIVFEKFLTDTIGLIGNPECGSPFYTYSLNPISTSEFRQKFINFCANDYLNIELSNAVLAQHEYAKRYCPYCGNTRKEGTEVCDGVCCNNDCKSFAPQGTVCNDGLSATFGDTCDGAGVCKGRTISLQICGNGKVEGTEQCDAGLKNGIFGSGCTKDCKKTSLTPTFPTLSR